MKKGDVPESWWDDIFSRCEHHDDDWKKNCQSCGNAQFINAIDAELKAAEGKTLSQYLCKEDEDDE